MATPIGQLAVDLLLQSTEFVRSINRASDEVNQLGRAVEQQNNMMSRGFAGVSKAAGALQTGLAALGATVSVGAFAALVKGAINSADALSETAQRTGVAVEALQQWQFAAAQTGSSAEQMSGALEFFNRQVGKAAQGSGSFGKVLADQGVAFRDASGAIQPTNEMLLQFADAVAKAGSVQEQTALVTGAFGRSASELVPLFAKGAEGIRAYLTEAESFGLVTTQQADAANAANDAMNKLSTATGTAFTTALVGAAPALEAVANGLTALVINFQALDPIAQSAIATTAAVAAGFVALAPILGVAVIGIGALVTPIGLVAAALVGGAGLIAAIVSFRKEIGAGLTAAVDKVAATFEALRDRSLAAVQALVEGVQAWLGDRLEGALAGVQARVQGVTDAFAAMYTAVVGESYVPDMVNEIQGWMERLGGPAMVDPAKKAVEETNAAFRKMSEEEMARRIGQQEASRASSLPEVQTELSETESLFQSTAQSLADTFNRTFENILQEGVTSFEDLADSVGRIFTNLTASIGQSFGATFASLGAFGGPLGSFAGGALGVGAMFGLQQLGGMLGIGGGGQSNKISIGSAGLGVAGAGGTGAGAQFVNQIDQQLMGLLPMRLERLANAALRAAPPTSVQYSKEPSANDLAALAGGRIRPAAQALGFSSAVGRGAPEQQFANFQAAVGLMQQVQDIRLGPLDAELENLKTNFLEASKAAQRFGVDHYQALEEQYRRERQAISRRFASERVGLEEMFGQRSSTSAALSKLKIQFDEAAARAEQLGLSTSGMSGELAKAQEAVREQGRQQRQAIVAEARGLANLPETFQSTVSALKARFAELRGAMEELGGSTASLAAIQQQALEALSAQRRERLQNIAQEARGLVNLPNTFKSTVDDLAQRFSALRAETRALGGSVEGLTKLQRQAGDVLREQRRVQLEAIQINAQSLTGLDPTFGQELDELNRRFVELRTGTRALGGDVRVLTLAQREALANLKLEQQLRQDQMALSIVEPFKRLSEPLRGFQDELEVSLMNPLQQMQDAEADFQRIAKQARAGNLAAIEQLTGAGQRFIQESGRFGASPAVAAATREVQNVLTEVISTVERAQKAAASGLEDVIKKGDQRQIDKLSELIEQGRLLREEVKRAMRR